ALKRHQDHGQDSDSRSRGSQPVSPTPSIPVSLIILSHHRSPIPGTHGRVFPVGRSVTRRVRYAGRRELESKVRGSSQEWAERVTGPSPTAEPESGNSGVGRER